MLWVEYPVGVGFSIGEIYATTEEEIAADFVKFFKNFEVQYRHHPTSPPLSKAYSSPRKSD